MKQFGEWLRAKIDESGWTYREVGRRGEISESMISKVINGYAQPGPDFCRGIARAFKLTEQEVFERAGILQPPPHPENEGTIQSMLSEMRQLDATELRSVRLFLQALLREKFSQRGKRPPQNAE